MSRLAISINDVHRAELRIRPFVRKTAIVPTDCIDGVNLHLKCENFQHIHAFKARGACNAVFNLNDEDAAAGIVTHSSGNHAAAIARAGRLRGVPVTIVMPQNSSPLKIDAVRSFGIDPVFCEPSAESRQTAADDVVQKTGATFIHPFDNVDVMAGQGTVGLELLNQIPSLETVIVPVGGGGLLSGIATVMRALKPSVEIIGAEPAWADDTARSMATGIRQNVERYDTICDGLRTPVGALTFPIISQKVDSIETVSEDEVRSATVETLMHAKILVEPSAAVAIAVAKKRANNLQEKTVAVVITGGNIAREDLLNCWKGPPE